MANGVEKTARTVSQFVTVALVAAGLGVGGVFAAKACKDVGPIQDWPKHVLAWRDKEFRKLIKIDQSPPDFLADFRGNTPDWDKMKKGWEMTPQQLPPIQFQPQFIPPQPHTIEFGPHRHHW